MYVKLVVSKQGGRNRSATVCSGMGGGGGV